MRRALILGSRGLLGGALLAAAWTRAWAVRGLDRRDLDITDRDEVARAIARADPDLVVNAAGVSDPDAAEREPAAAHAVNRDGAASVAEACARRQVPLVCFSAADVFDGALARAWREDDPVSPINVLGASKAAGESEVRRRLETHVIIRTSWLFGSGGGVLPAILTLGAEGGAPSVAANETARPTAVQDLAAAVARIADRLVGGIPAWGTFHFANSGAASRADFVAAMLRMAGLPPATRTAGPAAWPREAPRPQNAVLDCARIESVYGVVPRDWRDALAELLPLAAPARMRASGRRA
jgi:dTDP-4-dehydrorhamnose reductase